ncbi:hypothetical protein CA237_18820 [Sphingomonas sp. ABOLH]|nr:hypothetical protein CA237_18820 [Sphingomonas sp. ABOLH]
MPGRLNADGCHTDRKGGTGYQCHRSVRRATSAQTRPILSESTNFPDCAAARAAGSAPVQKGDLGYSWRLE